MDYVHISNSEKILSKKLIEVLQLLLYIDLMKCIYSNAEFGKQIAVPVEILFAISNKSNVFNVVKPQIHSCTI